MKYVLLLVISIVLSVVITISITPERHITQELGNVPRIHALMPPPPCPCKFEQVTAVRNQRTNNIVGFIVLLEDTVKREKMWENRGEDWEWSLNYYYYDRETGTWDPAN